MPRTTLMVVLIMLLSCKKPDESHPGSAAPAGSGVKAAPADAASTDAGAAPAAGTLAFDTVDPASDASPLATAFAGKVPRLPALSADDQLLASFDGLGDGPMAPQPTQLGLAKFPTTEAAESLPILTVEEAAKATGDAWATPELKKQLATRAAAVLARLHGFRSLVPVELAINSNGTPQMTKIGELALWPATSDDNQLDLELRDGKNAVLQHELIETYQHGSRNLGLEKPVPCEYRPSLFEAYRDPAKPLLYLRIQFRYAEECDPGQSYYLVWSLDPAAASPVAAIRNVVTSQFGMVGMGNTSSEDLVTPDAVAISAGFTTPADHLKPIGVVEHAMDFSGHDDKDVQVVISRDGKSAWASELTSITILTPNTSGHEAPWRASDVLIKTPKGWRIAALAWTEPRPNDNVNRDAKAGKLAVAKLDGPPGDAGLLAAFAALTTQGVDATAAARADLVAIGSGPGERTLGGAGFARAWNAAWKGKVTIASSIARAMPSGTTGWVAATIELAKPGAKLPFTVFCVFDKDAGGAWSLVHIQFTVGRS